MGESDGQHEGSPGSSRDRGGRSERAALARRTVVESTTGTTGISLAFVCAAKGYHIEIVFSDAFSDEKRRTMQAFGANITDVKSDNKRITETLTFRWAMKSGGRATGTSRRSFIRSAQLIRFTASRVRCGNTVETSTSSPWSRRSLRFFREGSHKIEGIGIGFVPPLWEPDLVNEIQTVTTDEAKAMTRRQAREEGIFAGTQRARMWSRRSASPSDWDAKRRS